MANGTDEARAAKIRDMEDCADELHALAFIVSACGDSIFEGGVPCDSRAVYAFAMIGDRLRAIAESVEATL